MSYLYPSFQGKQKKKKVKVGSLPSFCLGIRYDSDITILCKRLEKAKKHFPKCFMGYFLHNISSHIVPFASKLTLLLRVKSIGQRVHTKNIRLPLQFWFGSTKKWQNPTSTKRTINSETNVIGNGTRISKRTEYASNTLLIGECQILSG